MIQEMPAACRGLILLRAAAVVTGTGAAGVATHSGSVAITNNPDGSTTIQRAAETNTASTIGSSNIQHQGTTTTNPNGTATYSGSTSVDSTHGNVSTQTQAGNGQVTTAVTTNNGTTHYTAGDGQVQNLPAPDTSARTTGNGNRSKSTYNSINPQQLNAANQALSNSWSSLSQQLGVGAKTSASIRSNLSQQSPAPFGGANNAPPATRTQAFGHHQDGHHSGKNFVPHNSNGRGQFQAPSQGGHGGRRR